MDESAKPSYFGRDLEAMSFARNYHGWIVEEFQPYIGGTVAEVGAGTGNFSELLLQHAARLVSFEPSSNMYPALRARFAESRNVETVNSPLGAASDRFGAFDTVVYVNVLEHIEDDAQELSLAFKALRQGGHLLVFVPALPFLYGELDRNVGHVRRYYKRDLVARAQASGFRVARVRYFDFAGILPWYVAFVLLRRPITGTKVDLYDRFVVPLMRRIERHVTPPIGKNLLLIARKF